MDLLYQSAVSWLELCRYTYRITYGKQKVLHEVLLKFERGEFYHLAGFQYLTDIVFPFRFSTAKAIDIALSGTLSEAHLKKSKNYTMLYARLSAITQLKQALDSSFKIYQFDSKVLPFYTKITAKHLISAEVQGILFLFTDENESGGNYAKSIFTLDGNRDYRRNQKALSILRIERENGEKVCLFSKY